MAFQPLTTTLRLWCSAVDRSGEFWREDVRNRGHKVEVPIEQRHELPDEQPCPVKGCDGVIQRRPSAPKSKKKATKKKATRKKVARKKGAT